jgi:alpha-aminoadipate carrier protein LysW
MAACKCPICDTEIELEEYEENDVIECPICERLLEIVSLVPPVLEEVPDMEEDWDYVAHFRIRYNPN